MVKNSKAGSAEMVGVGDAARRADRDGVARAGETVGEAGDVTGAVAVERAVTDEDDLSQRRSRAPAQRLALRRRLRGRRVSDSAMVPGAQAIHDALDVLIADPSRATRTASGVATTTRSSTPMVATRGPSLRM